MKLRRAVRPDAQAFDEIRITTLSRYKTSGLSGDEWRISANIEFMRKGKVITSSIASDVAGAARNLSFLYEKAVEEHANYAGEEAFCDQEGCQNKGTVTYIVKKMVCPRCGEKKDWPNLSTPDKEQTAHIRCFCMEHACRGDCGIDDADSNYEAYKGEQRRIV